MLSKLKLKLGILIAAIFGVHGLEASQLPLTNYYFEEYMISQRTYCLFFKDDLDYETVSSRGAQELSGLKKTSIPKTLETQSEVATNVGDKASLSKETENE